MSLVADEHEWRPDYLDRVVQGAAMVGSSTRDALRQAVRRRVCRLFLVTLLERWALRGLTGEEIARGLGASADARRCIAGLLGARNAALGGRHPWFRKDERGRWHPTRALRWEPWLKAAAGRR
ncbi:MAG: hypothetical protein AB7T63_04050 [Planctomycetota bacterium]